jgi:arylamine N-acetyltransferase
LAADISSAAFSLNIKSVTESSKFGLMTHNPFDLYFFDSNSADYECFVEKSNKWARYHVAEFCDFLGQADWVHPNLFEYHFGQSHFLNAEATHTDFFMVIDNSGWYGSLSNERAEHESHGDVIFDLEVTTHYYDNDVFNLMYLMACMILVVLVWLLLAACIGLKYQKYSYSKIVEE